MLTLQLDGETWVIESVSSGVVILRALSGSRRNVRDYQKLLNILKG